MAEKESPCGEINKLNESEGKLRKLLESKKTTKEKEETSIFSSDIEFQKNKDQFEKEVQQLTKTVGEVSETFDTFKRNFDKLNEEIRDAETKSEIEEKQEKTKKFSNKLEENVDNISSEEYKVLSTQLFRLSQSVNREAEYNTKFEARQTKLLTKIGIDIESLIMAINNNNGILKEVAHVANDLLANFKEKKIKLDNDTRKKQVINSPIEQTGGEGITVNQLSNFTRIPQNENNDIDVNPKNSKCCERLYELNYEMWGTLLDIKDNQEKGNKFLNDISNNYNQQEKENKAEGFQKLRNKGGIGGKMGGLGGSLSDLLTPGGFERQIAGILKKAAKVGISSLGIGGAIVTGVAGAAYVAGRIVLGQLNKELNIKDEVEQDRQLREKNIFGGKQDLKSIQNEKLNIEEKLKNSNLSPNERSQLEQQKQAKEQQEKDKKIENLKKELEDLGEKLKEESQGLDDELHSLSPDKNTVTQYKATINSYNKLFEDKKKQLFELQGRKYTPKTTTDINTINYEPPNQSIISQLSQNGPMGGNTNLPESKRTPDYTGLGSISENFESGGKGAGVISSGSGDLGGASYGAYQLSSKTGTLQEYLKSSGYDMEFAGLKPGSKEFNDKWKSLAATDSNFSSSQKDFIANTHYKPQLEKLSKEGIDLSKRGKSVQESVFSTATQFGPNTSLIENALKGKDINSLSDADIVSAIQDYKIQNNDKLFKSSSLNVQKGTLNRANQEKIALLNLAKENPNFSTEGANSDGKDLMNAFAKNQELLKDNNSIQSVINNNIINNNGGNSGAGLSGSGQGDLRVQSPRATDSTFSMAQASLLVSTGT